MLTIFTCMAFELPYTYVIGTNRHCIKDKPRYKCQINSHAYNCVYTTYQFKPTSIKVPAKLIILM